LTCSLLPGICIPAGSLARKRNSDSHYVPPIILSDSFCRFRSHLVRSEVPSYGYTDHSLSSMDRNSDVSCGIERGSVQGVSTIPQRHFESSLLIMALSGFKDVFFAARIRIRMLRAAVQLLNSATAENNPKRTSGTFFRIRIMCLSDIDNHFSCPRLFALCLFRAAVVRRWLRISDVWVAYLVLEWLVAVWYFLEMWAKVGETNEAGFGQCVSSDSF
jgi:hypothetical protein